MPVLEQLAAEYPEVAFVAVAGRSNLERTISEADRLGLAGVMWGYDEGLWETYQVFGQPTAFLITADDKVFAGPWFRVTDEDGIREGVEELLALHS